MKEIITTLTKKQNLLSQQNQLVKRFLKSKLFRVSFLTCIYEGGQAKKSRGFFIVSPLLAGLYPGN